MARVEPELTDQQWQRFRPFIPRTKPVPTGGRPGADDRACLGELDARGVLEWEEDFVDGSFAQAKKGGLEGGKTRHGNGTKWMVAADGMGLPIGRHVGSANPFENTLTETVLDAVRVLRARGRPRPKPKRLIEDRAYDSRRLLENLRRRGIQLIAPARPNRFTHRPEGRKLRRYKCRWRIERCFA